MGAEADAATRRLAEAWVRAWDELAPLAQAAASDLVAAAIRAGRWPQPWQLAQVQRLQTVLTTAQEALGKLGDLAGVTVADAAGTVIRSTAEAEPPLIASQLPAAEQAQAISRFAARILPTALNAIVARTQANIVSQTRPLSADAMESMRRALITGVAVGSSPRDAAADMVDRVEGAFNGGLTRAMTIARTEILDAYRTASGYAHNANADVLDGWRWLATLDRRTCPACWSKNGTQYPVSTPGPWGHQNCRCARVPVVKDWSALGIHGVTPPAPVFPDARARFAALPEADQLAIMGPGRLRLLKSGRVSWDDLAMQRQSTGWRPSYAPTPVRDLQRLAARPGTRAPEAPAAKLTLADHIASGEAATRPLGGGMAARTELVTFNDGTQAVRKTVLNQWIRDPVEAADAEELASVVLRRAGVIAPEVYRAAADTVYMDVLPGMVADEHWPLGTQGSARVDDEMNAFVSTQAGRRLGLLDQVILNTDRNSGNWTVEGLVPGAIDHGGAFEEPIPGFDEAAILRTVRGPTNRFAYRLYHRYTPEDVDTVRGFLNDVRPEFVRLKRVKWWDAAMARLDRLATEARGTERLWP